jgi:AraC-like DNA-binding protein
VVSGPYAGAFLSDTAEEAALLGIHFRPGGAWPILGVPADEFTNLHVDLQALWGPEAAILRERLCAAREPGARFLILERALADRLLAPMPHGAVRAGLDMLRRSQGRAKIRDVANALDVSPRRFRAVFAAEIGLTPKLYGRVQRFQHAAAEARSAAVADWAQLAVACGYFDQSHLIHEFVEFSGLTPAEYRRDLVALDRAGTHVKRHHVPVAD